MYLCKMSKIEVDPMLFIKCRLCLSETGQYQIVPNVQMQIKYCFDIDVEPFDGLPQLVCKKCESILSHYTGMKQIFQEKQKVLNTKLSSNRSNVHIDNIIQKQQNSASFTQAVIENKNKAQRIQKYKRKTTRRYSTMKTLKSNAKNVTFKTTQSKNPKEKEITWQSTFTKYFVCRFCNKSFRHKKIFNNHIQKQCKLCTKYSNMNKTFCLVELNKIGTKPNITESTDKVVCNKYKIIESKKAAFYILYTKELNEYCNLSDYDRNFLVDKNKRKRQCLNTTSPNKSIIIKKNIPENSDDRKVIKVTNHEKDARTVGTDIECKNKKDFDSNSTKPSIKKEDFGSGKPFLEKTNTIHDKMISNIIARCSNKYMESLNQSEGQNTTKGQKESSLKHEIVNIGSEIIYSKELNTILLLRSMAQKNLEVVWLPKDSKVTIKTRPKEKKDSHGINFDWENITSVTNFEYVTEDFSLVFERLSELEAYTKKNSKDKQFTQANSHNITSLPNLKYENEDFAPVFESLSELEACINKNNEDNQLVPVNQKCQEKVTETEQEETTLTYFGNLKKHKIRKVEKTSTAVSDKVPSYVDSETKVSNNTFLRNDLNMDKTGAKLLNANPVANPKKLLTKKKFGEPKPIVEIYLNELKNDSKQTNDDKNNLMLYMPCQTSIAAQLAPFNKERADADRCNKNANKMNIHNKVPQSTLPKIQCKPISELMSDIWH